MVEISPQDIHGLDLLLPGLSCSLPVLPLPPHVAQPGDGLLGEGKAHAEIVESLNLHVDDVGQRNGAVLKWATW